MYRSARAEVADWWPCATGTLPAMATPGKGPKPTVKGTPMSSTRLSRRSIVITFSVAVVAAIALIGGVVVLHKNSAPPPVAAPVANVDGIPQSGRALGSPKAKVTLVEFADPQCPGCRYYTLNIYPKLVDDYVRTGKVKTEYHGFPFIGPDSIKALRFIMAASFQNKLWQLMEALYGNRAPRTRAG